MAVLDIRNLIYWYRTRRGAVHAVDNISFKLEQGETIAVVGESGCGKTSTANAILRLLPKNVERYEGEIWFDGQDIMAGEGRTHIFATHDLGLASDVADHVAIMYAGEIDEIGPADHVFVHPKHPYTGRLLASVPRLRSEDAPEFIPGAPPDLTRPPPGCRFHLRCPVAFEKCGWVAEEFVDRLRLLQATTQGKEG